MLLGDVVFWLGIVMLASGLYWRIRLRRGGFPPPRSSLAGPAALMLGGVALAIFGLLRIGAL